MFPRRRGWRLSRWRRLRGRRSPVTRVHAWKATYEMENEIMHTTNLITETASRPRLNWVAALSALALLIGGSFQSSLAQKSGPETFSSPGKATSALFQAVQNSDEEVLAMIFVRDKE